MNTCLGFLGVNVGTFAIRYLVGYRSILSVGALGCGLSQLAAAISASIMPSSPNIFVAFMAMFMVFYNGCIATASYIVATEVPKLLNPLVSASLCAIPRTILVWPPSKAIQSRNVGNKSCAKSFNRSPSMALVLRDVPVTNWDAQHGNDDEKDSDGKESNQFKSPISVRTKANNKLNKLAV
ncbi:hypothetical protein N7522_001322 [Penicillium canescens]|nr:hypothetical protein N7522_001322 [Penicillium canescens]